MMHTKIMDPEAIHIVSPQQTPEENLKPFSNLPKPKKPSLLIVILVLIAAIALATTFYFANQLKKLKEKPEPAPIPASLPTPAPTEIFTPAPTIDPTADWKTYTHPNVPFTFKYPSGTEIKESITIRDESRENSIRLIKQGPTQIEGTELYDGLGLRLGFNTLAGRRLEELVDERVAESEEIGTVLEEKRAIEFQKYKAYTYKAEGLGISEYIYLQTPDESTYIEIVNFTEDPTEQGFESLVDQILSTLRLDSGP